MNSWLKRFIKRQRDLTEGADTDLVHGNRRRFAIGLGVLAAGFLLIYWSVQLSFAPTLHKILVVAGILLFLAGAVLAEWASREWWSLHKPDPEEPPSILKK